MFNFRHYSGMMGTQEPDPDKAIAEAQEAKQGSFSPDARAAVLLIKIDNFARLRREYGIRRAEQFAAAMVPRLEALLYPERVTVVAQDVIELTITGLAALDLQTAVTAISHLFAEPVIIDDSGIVLDVALGGAVVDLRNCCELRLIEEAESALGDAVRIGAPSVRSLDENSGKFDRATLSRDLVTAMRDEELLVHYQPKVHLRRRHIASVEALLRWQHPTKGLVSPNDFIPLAEETGDIAALTLWALRRVIHDQRIMAESGHNLTVFVNIAGVLLSEESFVRRACELIVDTGVPIGFEITETSVIRDPESAMANLNRFAAIGIPIAIDDYGAGLSSLAYLKQLPARELKIDKLFVTQLTSSHRDPLIVRSTIDLAHALEMEVVAEGVETQTAFALLSVMGCDMAQGFFISRPVGLHPLLTFLDEHRDGWADSLTASPFPALVRRA